MQTPICPDACQPSKIESRSSTRVVPALRRDPYAVFLVSAVEQMPSAPTDARGYGSRRKAGTTIGPSMRRGADGRRRGGRALQKVIEAKAPIQEPAAANAT